MATHSLASLKFANLGVLFLFILKAVHIPEWDFKQDVWKEIQCNRWKVIFCFGRIIFCIESANVYGSFEVEVIILGVTKRNTSWWVDCYLLRQGNVRKFLKPVTKR